ncbi:MAG: hypothetical protein R6X25_04960 [Candidatus Krumholzibacteriia bacterium]
MSAVDRTAAHLVLAAIRVLAHREGRPPAPEQIAELLQLPDAMIRLQLASLQDLGAVTLVESAFATHAEVRDHRLVDELPAAAEGQLSSDLADFDRRKQEEAERMAQLFADGDHERRRGERVDRMGKELDDFRRKKPRNPFGE